MRMPKPNMLQWAELVRLLLPTKIVERGNLVENWLQHTLHFDLDILEILVLPVLLARAYVMTHFE